MNTENTPIPIKIQLNSERAVRKLLDGDPELQIMVKKEIARSIAESYMGLIMKSVDTKLIIRDVERAVRNSINAEMLEFKERNDGYGTFPVLNEEYTGILKSGIEKIVDKTIMERVPNIEMEIKNRVDHLCTWADRRVGLFTTQMAEKITSESIQREVNLKVDKRIAAIKDAL